MSYNRRRDQPPDMDDRIEALRQVLHRGGTYALNDLLMRRHFGIPHTPQEPNIQVTEIR